MQTSRTAPHKQAGQAYSANMPAIVLQLFLQILLRAAAFSPMIITGITGRFFLVKGDHVMAVAFLVSLPLYLLIVMPFRFHFYANLARYLGHAHRDANISNYGKWLSAGLYRLLRSLPFLLPLIVYAALYYYYMRVADLTRLPLLILDLGALVGGTFSEGTAILVIISFIAFLIAFFGWRRSLLFECLPVAETGIASAWQRSRMRRTQAAPVSRINFLLCLPGLIAIGAVLVINLSQDLSGSFFEKIFSLLPTILNVKFPPTTYYQMLIALIIFYLPLLPLRKLALSQAANAA